MIRIHDPWALLVTFGSLAVISCAEAQTVDRPMTRLRPIGSSSAVDPYRSKDPGSGQERYRSFQLTGGSLTLAETAPSSAPTVAQAIGVPEARFEPPIALQQYTAPPFSGEMSMPGAVSPPTAPVFSPAPSAPAAPLGPSVLAPMSPVGLPPSAGNAAAAPIRPLGQIPSSSDMATADDAAAP